MKSLRFARAFGASFALVLLGFLAAHANIVLPLPSVSGPSLGDPSINLFSLTQALQNYTFSNFYPAQSVSQTVTQAACTALNSGINQITTSAAAGSVCLPTAKPGTTTIIANQTTQTINIFGANQFAVPGTQDTINGTVGSTAYAGLTTGKTATCTAVNLGVNVCVSGS